MEAFEELHQLVDRDLENYIRLTRTGAYCTAVYNPAPDPLAEDATSYGFPLLDKLDAIKARIKYAEQTNTSCQHNFLTEAVNEIVTCLTSGRPLFWGNSTSTTSLCVRRSQQVEQNEPFKIRLTEALEGFISRNLNTRGKCSLTFNNITSRDQYVDTVLLDFKALMTNHYAAGGGRNASDYRAPSYLSRLIG